MAVTETAPISFPVLPNAAVPSSKSSRAAIIAAPSASFPSAAATTARCPGRYRRPGPPGRNGVKEVVLTGVDITGYGTDLPGKTRPGSLVRRLLNLVRICRAWLSSIDVVEVDA